MQNKALFDFFAIVEIVNIAASVVSNLLLTYMVVYRSSKEIGAYRYLLLAFAVNDIYFPIVHWLTLPIICVYENAWFMFSHGYFTTRASIMVFAVTFSQTLPILCHLFVYRLIATKWPTKIGFYTAKSCFGLVVITILAEWILWMQNGYYNFAPDQEMREYVKPYLDEEFSGDDFEIHGALFYTEKSGYRWRGIIATTFLNTLMTLMMSVIIYCAFSIASHFRNANVKWSGKTKRLQQQLFYTLVVQTIIPIIFVCSPCAVIINLPMLGTHLTVVPNLCSASLTIFPLLDAFIIMFGVKSYRQALLDSVKCFSRATVKSNPSSQMTMTVIQ